MHDLKVALLQRLRGHGLVIQSRQHHQGNLRRRRKRPPYRFQALRIFQPKVELATGRVKGAEALARWRHAQHGIVAPYAFIKPLEDNGLIDELTWVMLRKAAAFCSAWRATGVDATASVNLSLKSPQEISQAALGLPSHLATGNYSQAWSGASLGPPMLNSTMRKAPCTTT